MTILEDGTPSVDVQAGTKPAKQGRGKQQKQAQEPTQDAAATAQASDTQGLTCRARLCSHV